MGQIWAGLSAIGAIRFSKFQTNFIVIIHTYSDRAAQWKLIKKESNFITWLLLELFEDKGCLELCSGGRGRPPLLGTGYSGTGVGH